MQEKAGELAKQIHFWFEVWPLSDRMRLGGVQWHLIQGGLKTKNIWKSLI